MQPAGRHGRRLLLLHEKGKDGNNSLDDAAITNADDNLAMIMIDF